jgi:hypothetical protein
LLSFSELINGSEKCVGTCAVAITFGRLQDVEDNDGPIALAEVGNGKTLGHQPWQRYKAAVVLQGKDIYPSIIEHGSCNKRLQFGSPPDAIPD